MKIYYDEDEFCFKAETEDDVIYRTLDGDDEESEEEYKQGLVAIMENIDENIETARKFAASQLLELKNKTWLEDGEEPITAEEFAERLVLSEVISMGDIIEFWFDDDDIFWGHQVRVDLHPDGTPDCVEIA